MAGHRESMCVSKKMLKAPTRPHSSEFYDSLSRVPLTRRSLAEFQQRLQKKVGNSPRSEDPEPTHLRAQQNAKLSLKRFARRGGPEMHDIRGFRAPAHIIRSIDVSTDSTIGTKPRSSAYDAAFEQHLTDHGIHLNNFKSEPKNLKEIQQRLQQRRSSLSSSNFPQSRFEDFRVQNEYVISERKVMSVILPTIYGRNTIFSEGDLVFTRLNSITNGVTVDAKPDLFDGAYIRSIHKPVRDHLGSYIIPTKHSSAPIAPNFFLEAKAPSGDWRVLKRQACYDGALGARGMHELQSYGNKERRFDQNSYTLSATYIDGILRLYATHPDQSGCGVEYHMTLIKSWPMTDDVDNFRQGATAFRNARELALEWREEFIAMANERAMTPHSFAGRIGWREVIKAIHHNNSKRYAKREANDKEYEEF